MKDVVIVGTRSSQKPTGYQAENKYLEKVKKLWIATTPNKDYAYKQVWSISYVATRVELAMCTSESFACLCKQNIDVLYCEGYLVCRSSAQRGMALMTHVTVVVNRSPVIES